MHPALSPQGDAIAFVSDRTGAFEIHVRGLGGGSSETPLTSDGGQNVQPAWSPDGRSIAYHSLSHGGIWVIAARGGPPRQITTVGARPAWSPDGRRIAYQSDEHGDVAPNGYSAQAGSTIWVVDADGANARAVTATVKPAGGHSSPSWSHDGRFIVFSVFDGLPDNGIWVIATDTGEVSPLDRGQSLYDPVFAKDDSCVYAAGADAFLTQLPFDAKTGKLRAPRTMIPVPGVPGVRGLSLSVDGRASRLLVWPSTARSGRCPSPQMDRRAATPARSPPAPAAAIHCRSCPRTAGRSPTCRSARASCPTCG